MVSTISTTSIITLNLLFIIIRRRRNLQIENMNKSIGIFKFILYIEYSSKNQYK